MAIFSIIRKPRIVCSRMFYLIGGRYKHSSNNSSNQIRVSSDIIRFDLVTFRFKHLERIQIGRFNHQTVEMNGRIYIAGGMNNLQMHLKLVEAFDYYDNEKVNSSFMINSRQDFVLVNYNFNDNSDENFLLAIGGCAEYPNLVEKYDPKINKWSIFDSIDSLPIKGFRSVKIKQLIYIIGGTNELNQPLDQTLCYNPKTRQIKYLNPMNEPRSSHCCVYAFGYIYVFGGCSLSTGKTTAERYSLVDDQWTYISDLNRKVENCCVTVDFNKLLLIGGEDPITKTISNRIDSYDPESNKWTNFKDLQFAISNSSLLSINELKF